MKLKIVIVDCEVPRSVRTWALRLGIPVVLLLGGGAVAWAAGLHTWSQNEPLNAIDLNGNFSYLQSEIAATQATQGNFVDLSSAQTVGGAKTFANLTVTGNASVQGTLGVGLHVAEGASCTYNGSYWVCSCAAQEVAIGGGIYCNDSAGTVGYIEESRNGSVAGGGPVHDWILTCSKINAAATEQRFQGSTPFALCARLGP